MKIIYKNIDGGVAVVYPTLEALSLLSLTEIAVRVTPKDTPFWIVEDSYLPPERTYRDAWQLEEDMQIPDGYGDSV